MRYVTVLHVIQHNFFIHMYRATTASLPYLHSRYLCSLQRVDPYPTHEVRHIFKCNAYSHSLDTHEMHVPIYTQCFLRTGCNFVSTRVCILMAFFRWYHMHSVFGGLRQTHHASLRSTLSLAPRVLIFVHTVSGASLALCHFLPRTVLCTLLTPCCSNLNLCCSCLVSR